MQDRPVQAAISGKGSKLLFFSDGAQARSMGQRLTLKYGGHSAARDSCAFERGYCISTSSARASGALWEGVGNGLTNSEQRRLFVLRSQSASQILGHFLRFLPRSTGFCAIWDCISSSSSFIPLLNGKNPSRYLCGSRPLKGIAPLVTSQLNGGPAPVNKVGPCTPGPVFSVLQCACPWKFSCE